MKVKISSSTTQSNLTVLKYTVKFKMHLMA